MKAQFNAMLIVILLGSFTMKVHSQNDYRNLIDVRYPVKPSVDGYYPMAETNDGGIIICQPMEYNSNIGWGLIRMDSAGAFLWAKHFTGTIAYHFPHDLISLPDGSFALSGTKYSGFVPSFYWHIDSAGNLITARWFENGLLNNGYRGSITSLADSSLVFTSYVPSQNGKGVLFKSSMQGAVSWAITYETTGAFQLIPKQIISTLDGGTLTAGIVTEFDAVSLYHHFPYLLKTDTDGNIQWFRQIRDSLISPDYVNITQTPSGDYYVSCDQLVPSIYNSTMKFDANGQLKWYNYYSTGNFYGFAEINDTLLIAASVMNFEDGPVLTVLDTAGNLIPYLSHQSNYYNSFTYSYNNSNVRHFLNDFALNENNQAVFYTSVDHPSIPSYKPVIIKTDSLFQSDCFTAGTNITESIPLSLVIDSVVSFSPFSLNDTDVTSSYNVTDMNLNSMDICALLSIEDVSYNDSYLLIRPNPANGNFNISMKKIIISGRLEIVNSIGEIIHSEIIFNQSEKEVNLGKVAEGIYFVKVFDGNKSYCKKLIVQ